MHVMFVFCRLIFSIYDLVCQACVHVCVALSRSMCYLQAQLEVDTIEIK